MTETRSVTVTLVVRPDDIRSGRPVWPADDTLLVRSGDGFHIPIPKGDGHFVFTGACPKEVRVTSGRYEECTLSIDAPGLLRVALIPKGVPTGRVFPLEIENGRCAYIGFRGGRNGYALVSTLEKGASELTLHKEDYAELCGLSHILSAPDGTEACVSIGSAAGGVYYLTNPSPAFFPPRSRVYPLARIAGGGVLRVPVPQDAQLVYLLRGSELQRFSLDG